MHATLPFGAPRARAKRDCRVSNYELHQVFTLGKSGLNYSVNPFCVVLLRGRHIPPRQQSRSVSPRAQTVDAD
jgi:hypothetical protein